MDVSDRNPYPFPALENDKSFSKRESSKMAGGTDGMTGPGGSGNPWNRLYATPTLSSTRRDVTYFDSQVPRDNLDFVMKCQYDHHGEFMSSKATVLKQPETVGGDHGRILKNRPEVVCPVLLEDQALTTSEDGKKGSINSSKGLSIESHHSEATNQGYSRKHDGGFYSV